MLATLAFFMSSCWGPAIAERPTIPGSDTWPEVASYEVSSKQSSDKQAAKTPKGTSNTQASVTSPDQPIPGYRVGADDELTISVWHEPELSQTVVVRPDGIITLPLLNDVKVAGMTTEELQTVLTEKLKTLVNDPQVTVSVKTVKSQRAFLMGAVGKQGVYPLSAGMTALQLIAQGGGLGPFAKSRSIYILRRQGGKDIRIPVNYKKALAGKGDDPILQSGDMVVVP